MITSGIKHNIVVNFKFNWKETNLNISSCNLDFVLPDGDFTPANI